MKFAPARLRNFSVTNVETLSVYGALSGMSVFVTLFLESYAHYSGFRAGVALLPIIPGAQWKPGGGEAMLVLAVTTKCRRSSFQTCQAHRHLPTLARLWPPTENSCRPHPRER